MANIENNIWETGDGRKIPLGQMQNSHLQNAFRTLCVREFKTYQEANKYLKKIDTLNELKDMLKKEAVRRNIKLRYPDEKEEEEK